MKLYLGFIALMGLLCLSACNNKLSRETTTWKGWKKYADSARAIYLQYPENWEFKETEGRLVFMAPREDSMDSFQENLLVWLEEMPLAINDSLYAQSVIAEIKIRHDSIDPGKPKRIQFDSTQYYHFRFNFPHTDGYVYTVKAYTCVKGKVGYNFSFTSDTAKALSYQPILDSILKSFKPVP